jgi:hypothetical protein
MCPDAVVVAMEYAKEMNNVTETTWPGKPVLP